jgi:2'-5' RNA ligase
MNPPDLPDNANNNILHRLFIAISCPPSGKIADLLKELQILALQSGGEIRVVAENNLHITLKFLGPVSPSSISPIAAAMDQLALNTRPFNLALAGAGIFKDAFWLGVSPCDALNELASIINQKLAPLGFTPETRPFIPHLTLARINRQSRSNPDTWLKQCEVEEWGSLQVQDVHLYKSETLPAGIKYSVLHTAEFKPQT